MTTDDLQKRLEKSLRVRLDATGSLEYALTWKHWDMRSGPRICALRASGRRTSDSGSTGELGGWKTPMESDAKPPRALDGRIKKDRQSRNPENYGNYRMDLSDQVALAGWPSPTVGNAKGGQMAKDASATGRRPDGSKATVSLNHVATMAGWPTCRAEDSESTGAHRGVPDTLTSAARLAGWSTPAARDHHPCGKHTNGAQDQVNLPEQARLAGWPTPNCNTNDQPEHTRRGKQTLLGCAKGASGPTSTSSPAATEKRGALNPHLSRWLMGFLPAWCDSAVTAMQSFPKSRRSSSKRSKKQ